MSYAAPSGAPPRPTHTSAAAVDDELPSDPPPAYTPTATTQGHTSVQSGPSHVDFSGPPPLPERQGLVESNITGVGVGYGPSNITTAVGQQYTGGNPYQNHGWAGASGAGAGAGAAGLSANPTGGSIGGAGAGAAGAGAYGGGWGRPPRHPSSSSVPVPGSSSSSNNNNNAQNQNPFSDASASSAGAGSPSRPLAPTQTQTQTDLSPTEAPEPGRPLLHRGQMLVYPKGHWCTKCFNTGYKGNDPSNPHESDWRKYGKPYTSALAHSYTISAKPNPHANPSTSSSSNFQMPLPSLAPAGSAGPAGPWGSMHPGPSGSSGQSGFAHLPPPPPPQTGSEKYSHLPPPPQQQHFHQPQPQQTFHQPQQQQIFVQATAGPAPPGALVVAPGDPRIGGRLCYRCNGSGRDGSFFSLGFGFDDGRCEMCGGLGRLF